jgi:hypothetical protein
VREEELMRIYIPIFIYFSSRTHYYFPPPPPNSSSSSSSQMTLITWSSLSCWLAPSPTSQVTEIHSFSRIWIGNWEWGGDGGLSLISKSASASQPHSLKKFKLLLLRIALSRDSGGIKRRRRRRRPRPPPTTSPYGGYYSLLVENNQQMVVVVRNCHWRRQQKHRFFSFNLNFCSFSSLQFRRRNRKTRTRVRRSTLQQKKPTAHRRQCEHLSASWSRL